MGTLYGLRRMFAADPVLVDVIPAGKAMPKLKERMLLHSGPPIAWERMCGPMQGAVAGAIVFEGWAKNLKAATQLAASGGVELHPNHHFGAVGPMTGITTLDGDGRWRRGRKINGQPQLHAISGASARSRALA
jgi:hypothetical protein